MESQDTSDNSQDKPKKRDLKKYMFASKTPIWEARASMGREKTFTSPEDLKKGMTEYFLYVQENPLFEFVLNAGKKTKLPKLQAMTIAGLCIFLDVNLKYFNDFNDEIKDKMLAFSQLESLSPEQLLEYDKCKKFSEVIGWGKDIIFIQKFTAASAGLINANIISRELGLIDKKDLTHSNPDGTLKSQVSFYIPDNGRHVQDESDIK